MSRVIVARCHNEDSCEPFTEHIFPAQDSSIVVETHEAGGIGEDGGYGVILKGGVYRVVDRHFLGHQVLVQTGLRYVWVDIDDIKEIL